MSGPRQILNRRWFLFALTVVALTVLAWQLGNWQFNRLEERKERNSQIAANEHHDLTDIEDVLGSAGNVPEKDEWRLVSATGTYRLEDQVVVRYRTRDGNSGVDVVVPLETATGRSVLVDRGWLQTENRGEIPTDIPAPPSGEVTVTGWLRANATGDSTKVVDHSTRAVNSEAIGQALDLEVYGGFVDVKSETPGPETALAPVEMPELDNGPHFFYGIQWWFFGALAVIGFFYLMYDEVWGSKRANRPLPLSRRRTAEDARHDESDHASDESASRT